MGTESRLIWTDELVKGENNGESIRRSLKKLAMSESKKERKQSVRVKRGYQVFF